MEAFKNPLTPDKEKEYINRCISGDNEARRVLIEYNLRLVAHIVKKYSSSVRDPEDLLSIGTIGLIKAIDSYKPEKGCKLAGYAAKCIAGGGRRQIYDAYRNFVHVAVPRTLQLFSCCGM